MTKFHIALEVADITDSIDDYSKRFGRPPETVVANEYALWRTETVNFSIRKGANIGKIRHIGFEDETATSFSAETDVNGVIWERFSATQQQQQIENIWGNNAILKIPFPN